MGVGLRGRGHTMLWRVLPICIVCPNAGNCESAFRAGAILDAILQHIVPGTADEQFRAVWTIGVLAIAVDISFRGAASAPLHRDLPGLVVPLWRRARLLFLPLL